MIRRHGLTRPCSATHRRTTPAARGLREIRMRLLAEQTIEWTHNSCGDRTGGLVCRSIVDKAPRDWLDMRIMEHMMNNLKQRTEHKSNITCLETDIHSFAKEKFDNDQ